MDRSSIGQKIRERRRELGLTQSGLAGRLGISASYLNLIESNKRNVAERLLPGLAQELEGGSEWLEGKEEQRIAQDLREVAGDPIIARFNLDRPGAADGLVARDPEWAKAIVALHRAYAARTQTVAALSDRLNQDPYLGEAVHTLLTRVTAIRSTAEILHSIEDLDLADRTRFQKMLAEESAELSSITEGIAEFFDTGDTETAAMTPAEEVDDLIVENRNYFPALEEAADKLRATFNSDEPILRTVTLIDRLESGHGVTVRFVPEEALGGAVSWNQSVFDPAGRAFRIMDGAPLASRRFQIARLICEQTLGAEIDALVGGSELLRSDEARGRAARALTSYAAAALLMPYAPFHEAAEKTGYDIELLARRFNASVEQICHRLVSLRKPEAEGIPFAFMRTDPAGFIAKRMPLPRLPLPRYGNACPLWVIYEAFQTPGMLKRQLARFPNGEQFLFVARAQGKTRTRFNAPAHLTSVMLACDSLYADRTVYASGLDLSRDGLTVPVGPGCRLCARNDCLYRGEPQMQAGGMQAGGRPLR